MVTARCARSWSPTTNSTRSASRPRTSSLPRAVPRRCSSPSCRASTPATRSSCPNRPTPTTWPSPSRPGPSSARWCPPSRRALRCPTSSDFEKLINERTRGILICNPNNPTGYLYTRREMNRIRDLVKKYDLFLFSDEVYREFIYTGSPLYLGLPPRRDRAECRADRLRVEALLECGIRIGALITKNRTLRNAVMKFCQARLSPPLLGQIVAEASIDAPRSYSTEVYEGVYRAPEMPDRRSEPHSGRLLAHSDGRLLHRGPAAGRGQRRLLRLVSLGVRIRGRDRHARPSPRASTPTRRAAATRSASPTSSAREDLERALVILPRALEAYNSRQR